MLSNQAMIQINNPSTIAFAPAMSQEQWNNTMMLDAVSRAYVDNEAIRHNHYDAMKTVAHIRANGFDPVKLEIKLTGWNQ